jgi:DNA-binding transcriptional regulator YdaS (Cro superfamily)
MSPTDHLYRAIEIAGGQCALARLVGRSQNAIWQSLQRRRVSVELALLIERALNGQVTRQQLRPDVFAGEHSHPLSGGSVRGVCVPSSTPRTSGF